VNKPQKDTNGRAIALFEKLWALQVWPTVVV